MLLSYPERGYQTILNNNAQNGAFVPKRIRPALDSPRVPDTGAYVSGEQAKKEPLIRERL